MLELPLDALDELLDVWKGAHVGHARDAYSVVETEKRNRRCRCRTGKQRDPVHLLAIADDPGRLQTTCNVGCNDIGLLVYILLDLCN